MVEPVSVPHLQNLHDYSLMLMVAREEAGLDLMVPISIERLFLREVITKYNILILIVIPDQIVAMQDTLT